VNTERNSQNCKTFFVWHFGILFFIKYQSIMKKISLIFFLSAALLFSSSPRTAMADGLKNEKTETSNFSELASRVIEIQSMDRSLMSRSEKKELRQELRLIKSELNDIKRTNKTNGVGPTIYISLGSLLLIILILLIIL